MDNMRSLIFVSMLVLLGCHESNQEYYYGDHVEFDLTGKNAFYSKVCKNHGILRDSYNTFSFFSSGEKRYLITTFCPSLGFGQDTKEFWVDEKDIHGLAKP